MDSSILKGLYMKYVLIFFCIFFLCNTVIADIKPSSLFSDHMILQKGVPVSVWGTADVGEQVTVRFNGQTVTSIATKGKWLVQLSPMPYITTPSSMQIMGRDTVTINDILVGEVWLCSGQSNMERQLGPRPPQPLITNWEKERDAANYPMIREYYVPLKYSSAKINDVNSFWTVCSPQTVADFSAVGYFFAKNLYNQINVPVGIVFSAYGGSPAEDWTSKTALESNPLLSGFVEKYDSIINASWHPNGEIINGLYNGMIYPLIPFSIKGVVWYQGESNNLRATHYSTALTTMIKNWRDDFNQGQFPFLIVQIAPFKDLIPELREAQLQVSQKVKNTALIVTTDCGNADNIHPSLKQPVGYRLSLAAQALAYKQKLEYSGPVYESYRVKKGKIEISFTHVGKGLMAKGSDIKGFTIAGSDKHFVPATAYIKGNKVVVYADTIPVPVALRYGWENVPDVNLFNIDGLPASPFRTDNN